MFEKAIKTLANLCRKYKPDIILACDSRGYLFGSPIAMKLEIGCVMARKSGKTPGDLHKISYNVEYGTERTLEIKQKLSMYGKRVLIVDDVLATGGTARALETLVEMTGCVVVGSCFLIEIDGLLTQPLKYPHVSLIHMNEGEQTTLNPIVKVESIIKIDGLDSKKRIILMYFPSMIPLVNKIVKLYPDMFIPSAIKWDKFADGFPNIYFDPNIKNRHVCFIGSLYNINDILIQLMVCIALPRNGVKSFTMIFPYYAPGTMERVDEEGQLASAEPLAKLMSSRMPITKTGLTSLCIYDIHALQNRFYFDEEVRLEMCTAINILLNYLKGQEK